MTEIQTSGSLKGELKNPRSPIRVFLDAQFAPGLRGVQAEHRKQVPTVPLVPPGTATAGTVGTAAEWVLKCLIHPAPSLHLPLFGAEWLDAVPGLVFTPALKELAEAIGMPEPTRSRMAAFTGPATGNASEPELLARACWAIALFTEAARAGQTAALAGPLGYFQCGPLPSAEDLLALAPADALEQLAGFRRVFEDVLLPQLADRPGGPWVIGPIFNRSRIINADGDLITAGLLLDVKTSKQSSLSQHELYQVISYALLDAEDEFDLDSVGLFNARYGHLATWDLDELLQQLTGRAVSLAELREEFTEALLGN